MKKRQQPLPTIEEALLKYWGYTSFRAMQRDIIDNIMAKRDTLALLPTGGGKSLTYQIPALAMDGICIVVTPLIALMKDQTDRLRQIGISAVAIHSGLGSRKIDILLDNCIYGDIKILYVAPERLASPLFQIRLKKMNVSMIAVDEAHCISQWGYDFRPSYLEIGKIRESLNNVPVLALTASATDLVCKDIMENLKFRESHIIRGDFSRPNLSYAIRRTEDKRGMLLRILSNVKGSAIVYVRTRKICEDLTSFLQESGESVIFYHGGLPHTERSLRQDEWVTGEYRVIVATNAFGMGIDKPDVRVVIHYTMCDSLEAYYQEAGRAGRDGARSYAALLVSPDDINRVEKSINNEFPSLECVKEIYNKICISLGVAYGEGGFISYNFDVREFCRTEKIYSGTFHSAIKILQMNGYLTLIDEMAHPARVMFVVSRDDLYRVRLMHEDLDQFIRIILRMYDGIFTEFRAIEESRIAMTSGYSIPQIKDMFKRLWRMRLIRYTPSNHSAMIYLDKHRLPINDLFISPQSYKYRKELYMERLHNMVKYVHNEDYCRSQQIEEYFGSKNTTPCGVCDICIEQRRKSREMDSITHKDSELRSRILDIISNNATANTENVTNNNIGALTTKKIANMIAAPLHLIVEELDLMVDEGIIKLGSGGVITHKNMA